MKPLTYTNRKGEEVMAYHVFKQLDPHNIIKTVEKKRRKKK